MGLNLPGPAEVIRACQRDNEFIKRLKQDIDEMVLEVFGQRVWLRFQEYSQQSSTLLYYALTNVLGNQTLGEEYVGVIQVNNTRRAVPSKKAISLMIFAEAFGTPFINYVLKMIENFNGRERNARNQIPNYLSTVLNVLLGVGHFYQSFVPLLTQLHLAVFYMNGQFYQFSKRISGIHYFLIRQYFGNEDEISKRNLKYLMWMSVINLAVTASHDSFRFISNRMREPGRDERCLEDKGSDSHRTLSVSDVDSTLKCSLCLEVRRHSSVTPCGHLFCWECIMDWLRNEAACPMCRELVSPSRIVPLQNFS